MLVAGEGVGHPMLGSRVGKKMEGGLRGRCEQGRRVTPVTEGAESWLERQGVDG